MKQLAIILLAVLCIGATFEAIDKDTVLKTRTIETVIDLRKLQAEIDELEASLPELKKEPDAETLEFFNNFMSPMRDDLAIREAELEELKKIT